MEVGSHTEVSHPPCQQTKPPIPGSAPLTFGSFFGGHARRPNLLDAPHIAYLTSGRMAIAQALLLEKIGPGDEVLVPAYHCSSMIAPINHSGAKVVFYRIQQDMTVNIEDIANKITPRCKLLMVAHYFGFPQPVSTLRQLCNDRGILLLEDCAHALFSNYENKPLGSFGDYAAGSLMKFFPINDGGFLTAPGTKSLGIRLEKGGKGFELKTALNTLEKSFIYKRLRGLEWVLWIPLQVKNLLWRWMKSQSADLQLESSPAASDGGFEFEPKWIHTRISSFSKLICKSVSTRRITERRRRNYLWLTKAFTKLPGCRPLFPDLPDNVVPYVFPVIVDNINPAFVNLRERGLPLLRWEYLDQGVSRETCQWSNYYSRHLVQIPCHQELKQKELELMIESIQIELSQ